MKTVIFSNYKVTDEVLNEAIKLLESKNISIIGTYRNPEDIPKKLDVDFVISLGGDGTLLFATHIFSPIPILPVNYRSVGAIIEVCFDNLVEAIERLKRGEYYIEESILLEARLISKNDNTVLDIALNEFLVINEIPGRAFKAKVFLDGNELGLLKGDGFIIATPTGSTGHSFSVGGSVIHPKLNAMIFTPIAPLYRKFAPIVLPLSSTLKAELLCDSLVIADGSWIHKARKGDILEFKVSDRKARFIRFLNPEKRVILTLRKILELEGSIVP